MAVARVPAVVVVVALAAVGAACEEAQPANACAVYLDCFFPDGGTAYPEARFTPPDGGAPYDYVAFRDEDTRKVIFDALGPGGYCWRRKIDGTEDTTLKSDCERACRNALVADCDRQAGRAPDPTEPPICLAADGSDDLTDHGSEQTCAELREELRDEGT